MISGLQEGYLDNENVTERKYQFQSTDAAKLFVDFCQGIDRYRGEEYRYGYKPKIKKGLVEVTITDIGE